MPEIAPDLRTAMMAQLDEIKDPCSVASGVPMGLSEMGLIGSLSMDEAGVVAIEMRLTAPFCHMIGFFKVEAKRRLMTLPGVTDVQLSGDLGLDWSPERISPAAQARRSAFLERMQRSVSPAAGGVRAA